MVTSDKIVMGLLFAVGILFLAGFAMNFTAWYVLRKSPEKVGRVGAKLDLVKHKKDVMVKAGLNSSGVIKDLTKGTYIYTVGDKTYRIRDDFIGTPRQTPRHVPVVYWKAFPRFAFIDTLESLSDMRYFFRAMLCLMFSADTFILVISLLVR